LEISGEGEEVWIEDDGDATTASKNSRPRRRVSSIELEADWEMLMDKYGTHLTV
jgi:hypothetical protein